MQNEAYLGALFLPDTVMAGFLLLGAFRSHCAAKAKAKTPAKVAGRAVRRRRLHAVS